jgi:hypothetical protein
MSKRAALPGCGRRARALAAFVVFAALAGGCDSQTFDPESKIESVRILATAADKPYAAPGDTVNMTVLAFDGRPSPSAPMNVYWIPAACIDPAGDAYSACFPALTSTLRPGVDLGPQLTTGTTFSFPMPPTAITAHADTGGDPYGLAVVFTIACAGHVEYVPQPAGGNPDAVPFGCFDDKDTQLGADDFVFAYSLVYAFGDRTNTNPTIQSLTLGGTPVDPVAGITLDHCTQAKIDDCPKTPLDLVVPASSQESDPGNLDADGHVLNEQLYVDYYLTAGKVKNDVVILFDPRNGRLSNTGDDLYAPQSQGDYQLWAVLHDNRGGATWQTFPLHAR